MQAVLVEIKQHQPAGKQPIEDGTPAESGREQFLAVEQDEFVGLGAKQRDIDMAEGAAAALAVVAWGDYRRRFTSMRCLGFGCPSLGAVLEHAR